VNGEEEFDDIKELLRMGALNTPVILINGVLKIHGGIPASVIRREVDKLLSTGPMH
jgi:predicted DsbA family dithiol-disulfide isomerase